MPKGIALSAAVGQIRDGSSLMIGGFMGIGSPHRLIGEPSRQGRKSLSVVANDTARPGFGIGRLIDAKLVRTLVVSHIGTNPKPGARMIAGAITVDLVPQGALAERTHAAGYGLGGVLTPTGVGTLVAGGAQSIEVAGRTFLLALPVAADFALVGDFGNLSYALTARNFNRVMARAATTSLRRRPKSCRFE